MKTTAFSLLQGAIAILLAGLSLPAFSATLEENQKPAPLDSEQKELSAAVQKMQGYVELDRRDPERPMLRIRFRSPGPKDGDLAQLRPALQKAKGPLFLNLNDFDAITDAGIAHLKDLPSLTGLAISRVKVTDAGLESLSGLTNLEFLTLGNDNITDAGLKHLAKLTKLRQLSVYGKKVTEAAYAHLEGMTLMEELSVGDSRLNINDACLVHMKGMTKLKELNLGGAKLTDEGMAHIKSFQELRSLRIDGGKLTKTGLDNLAALKKLEKFTIMSCPAINDEGTEGLKGLTQLQELEFIYSGSLHAKATASLKSLSKLRKLRFDSVEDDALAGIGGLTDLQDLQLFYTSVGDAGLAHLGGLTGLRSLNLMKTKVTDAGLKHLANLTNLQNLNLGENNLTDEGLPHLSGLAGLRDLYLADCKIKGPGLKHLAGLSKLQDLRVNGNPLTDPGLEHLKGMTQLKDLYLTGTKVSDEGVLALKKSLPKTRILDYAGDEVTLAKTEPKRRTIPIEDLSKTKADFSLTAEELAKEYKQDRSATNEKYKNKVIEVSGVVKLVGRNISDDAHVYLEAKDEFLGVACVTADPEPWSKVVPGQKVKLKGKWPETSFGVGLIYCVIVEKGESPAVTISAAGLAKEFSANAEETSKKYDKKYLIVTGEVIDREFNSVGAATIILKGHDKIPVKCHFTAFEKGVAKSMKVGMNVKLMGEYTFNFGNDSVNLYLCLPIGK